MEFVERLIQPRRRFHSTDFFFNTVLSFLHRLQGHTGSVTTVAWSAEDRYVGTGSVDKTVSASGSTSNGSVKRIFDFGSAVNEVCFSPNGKLIAAAGNDNTAKVWRNPVTCCVY